MIQFRAISRSRLAGPIVALALLPALVGGVGAQNADEIGTTSIPLTVDPTGQGGCAYDFDCDGLNDAIENDYAAAGMSSMNQDSDGDGLRDGDEWYNVTGYTYPNIWDSDQDGLSDGEEYFRHGTSNSRYDTDGDGVSDGQEVQRGTNPNGW